MEERVIHKKYPILSCSSRELNHHLQESKASGELNRKNGKTKKTVRSLQSGHFELESGRDRNGTFEPKFWLSVLTDLKQRGVEAQALAQQAIKS